MEEGEQLMQKTRNEQNTAGPSDLLLPDGSNMPRLGQGTWQMGEDDEQSEREIRG